MKGPPVGEGAAYWRARLDGLPPVLELPTDRPRVGASARRGREQLAISAEAIRGLGEAGARSHLAVLGAAVTLLQRYTRRDDLALAYWPPKGNGPSPCVLRCDVSDRPTFAALVRRLEGLEQEASAHAVPFERLLRELGVALAPGPMPLVQVGFAARKLDEGDSSISIGETRWSFDLVLAAVEQGDGVTLEAEFAAELFEGETIRRLLSHLSRLLRSAASGGRPIDRLPMLTEAEERQLAAWSETSVPQPDGHCQPTRFDRQVERTPDALAVTCEGAELTYRELQRRANRLAHLLRRLGAGPERLVGMCMERSLDMVVAVLGILKSGAGYVPLDVNSPADRLAWMLEDSGARVVVTQSALKEKFAGLSLERVVCLDAEGEALARESDASPEVGLRPGNLAYVIFTSGSTGRPKGVMIEHRSVMNLDVALQSAIRPSRQGPLRFTFNAPIIFDASVKHFLFLLHGHSVHVVPEGVRRDGAALLRLLERQRIDVLDCQPAQLRMLQLVGFAERLRSRPIDVLVGAEAVPISVWQELGNIPGVKLYNLYGPTECTVDATIGDASTSPQRPVIGRPIANTQGYVLDRQLAPVPVGVPGELYIGGAQLGRGYLGLPEMTAERFLPDPFSRTPGARMYRTGDLVRWLPNGDIDFLGRADHQVKIRGYRIELGEIEAHLASCPGVKEAVVLAREDTPGDQRLVAYVASALGPLDPAALRGYLASKLPDYMLPSTFVELPSLPRTPSGKVNRFALPAPAPAAPKAASALPDSPLELLVLSIWSDVLGVPELDAEQDFFAIGGHSLLAVMAATRVAEALEVEVSPQTIFDNPTIKGFVEQLRQLPDPERLEQGAQLFLTAMGSSEEELRKMLVSP